MVYTCCVPNCRTGYKSEKSNEKIQLFRFPINHKLKQDWIRAIPRQNWTVTFSHRVCAKHFASDNFDTISRDLKTSRKLNRDSEKLKRLRLKPNAIPHIFPNLASYLSKKKFCFKNRLCISFGQTSFRK